MDERVCLKLQDMIPERVLREENINEGGLGGVELVIDSPPLMRYFDKDLQDQKTFDDKTKLERQLKEAEKNAKEGGSECSTRGETTEGDWRCTRHQELDSEVHL